MQLIDLTGRTFGRLTVLRRAESSKWICRCSCGNEKPIDRRSLIDGRTVSCGCRMRETLAERVRLNTKHGQSAKGGTPTFHAWNAMKGRCLNPSNAAYADYGGRGITVCERWMQFENFLADMGERPPGKSSIDRYPNNDGNYEPGNCRWATPKQQADNRRARSRQNRNAILLTAYGETKTIKEWSRETGVKAVTIHWRLKAGYPPHRAVSPLI